MLCEVAELSCKVTKSYNTTGDKSPNAKPWLSYINKTPCTLKF